MKTHQEKTLEAERFLPDIDYGLSSSQVLQRQNENLVNYDSSVPTKTVSSIVRDNLFTLFNIINFILALAIIYVGSYKNLLFMGVIITNLIIGTYQEIRAKKIVDKLSLISSTKVTVIREGNASEIGINDVVLDDIVVFSPGNQIITDCIIVEGSCDVNEALLTGESDLVHKNPGDMLFSGSFVVSSTCKAKVEHVGEANYVSTISKGAKYVKKVNSEIMYTLDKIIKYLSIIIIPVGVLLFINQFTVVGSSQTDAVVNTVAAIIGMIPEGLILLTSTVLAVGVVRLSQRNVLVQELYCIETLARVDTLCLDKTGTITEGCLEIHDTIPYGSFSFEEISNSLKFLTSVLEDGNPTYCAIKEKYYFGENFISNNIIPFSSERKWSGAYLENDGSYIIGAPEFVLKNGKLSDIHQKLNEYAKNSRVIVLAKSKDNFNGQNLPENIELMAFILVKDKIRNNAANTMDFFNEQGVDIKIISGDNVLTVSTIAESVGVKNSDSYIDATTLNSYEDIKDAAEKYTIFGRVTPSQKKEIIIALKENGHTVAMTGDGVNDVLSLKEADCSIAMASGSDAARNVSHLVLMDSKFGSIPKIVAEGRRAINNIQRSSTLFLIKTIYSTALALIFLFMEVPYPFMPIQMTLISVLTIGIPSFVLALEPNNERIRGHFFRNILKKAVPGALTIVINIILIILSSYVFNLTKSEYSSISVILTAYVGLLVLFKISIPFNFIRKVLFISVCLGLFIGVAFFRNVFSLCDLTWYVVLLSAILMFVSYFIFEWIWKLSAYLYSLKGRKKS